MPRSKKQEEKPSTLTVQISTGTILRVFAIVGAIVFIYFLRDIVAIVLAAMLLSALIDPFADKLEKYRIPRGLSVGIVYSVLILILTFVSLLVIPPMLTQSRQLLENYAPYLQEITGNQAVVATLLSGDLFTQDVQGILQTIREAGFEDSIPTILTFLTSTFGALITVFLVFILAFYFVMEEDLLKRGVFVWIMPEKYKDFVSEVAPKIRKKIGEWVRGQLLLMFAVGLLTYIVLTLLNVPFALVLAIMAAVLEIIPYLGPMLSAIPAIIIAFSASPIQGLLVAILYFVIQQIEGDILTPKIMQKVAGLNPIVSILSILIGYQLAGVAGALLAVPFAMVVGVFLTEWFVAIED